MTRVPGTVDVGTRRPAGGRRFRSLSCLLGGVLLLLPAAADGAPAQEGERSAGGAVVEWPFVGSDPGNTRYSAADTLTPDNVDQLRRAWTWRPADRPRQEFGTVPGSFTSTPIMIDGTVYVSSNYNRVGALELVAFATPE